MTPNSSPHKLDPTSALSFILAGNAHFTFRHSCNKTHLTYKVRMPSNRAPGDTRPPVAFVSVPDPKGPYGYAYLGHITNVSIIGRTDMPPKFVHSVRSTIGAEDIRANGFKFVFEKLVSGTLNGCVEIWHEGSCGRCGRRLTVPESIQSGIGPECAKLRGGAR